MIRGRANTIAVVCAGLAAVAVLPSAGCASERPVRTTRLADADLTGAVLEVRDQLAGSRFLAGRDPGSEPVRLVVRRVENLSSDRIPVSEQWSLVSRIISRPDMQDLLRDRAVRVQLPPEKVALLERSGLDFPDLLPEDRPTHVMTAQIASGTRAGASRGGSDADVRKEYYLISFDIEDLQARELLWQGTAEVAREAEGTVVD